MLTLKNIFIRTSAGAKVSTFEVFFNVLVRSMLTLAILFVCLLFNGTATR